MGSITRYIFRTTFSAFVVVLVSLTVYAWLAPKQVHHGHTHGHEASHEHSMDEMPGMGGAGDMPSGEHMHDESAPGGSGEDEHHEHEEHTH